MRNRAGARYKWDSPGEWLSEKIQSLEVLDFYKLKDIATSMLTVLDGDQLQDLFQDDMDNEGYFDDLNIAQNLTRDQCVEILEAMSIECRDDETVEVLREAITANIDDGTLPYGEVEAILNA